MNNINKKYVSSAFLLLLSSLLVKVISAFYKIPLTSYIGATGRGYFTIAYNFYMPIHAIIMGAFPVAVTHLISKYNEKGDVSKIYSLKKASFRLFFIVGFIGMVLMIFLAKPYANIISSSPKSIYTIYVLCPTVLFSSLCASYRSLFEGHLNMVPTSISQIIEVVFKALFGLLFARISMNYLYEMYLSSGMIFSNVCSSEKEAFSLIYPITSAFAMIGGTIGSFFSFVYISLYSQIKYSSYKIKKVYSVNNSLKEILKFSSPIIISTLVQSISMFLDNASVQYCLSICNLEELKELYKNSLIISNTPDSDIVTYIYGIYSSAQDFKNLIPGFTMALGVAAVPAISSAFESKNKEKLMSLSNCIFKYTSILAFCGGFYLSIISHFILNILYNKSNYDIVIGCEKLVKYFGFTMIFYCLSGTVIYATQAIGCAKKSIPSFIISAIFRVFLNFIFISNAKFNLFGAVISGGVGYFIILVFNLYIYKKYSNIKYDLSTIIIKPLFCCTLTYFFTNMIIKNLIFVNNYILAFFVTSFIYLILFCVFAILSKTIEFEDIKMFCFCKKTR